MSLRNRHYGREPVQLLLLLLLLLSVLGVTTAAATTTTIAAGPPDATSETALSHATTTENTMPLTHETNSSFTPAATNATLAPPSNTTAPHETVTPKPTNATLAPPSNTTAPHVTPKPTNATLAPSNTTAPHVTPKPTNATVATATALPTNRSLPSTAAPPPSYFIVVLAPGATAQSVLQQIMTVLNISTDDVRLDGVTEDDGDTVLSFHFIGPLAPGLTATLNSTTTQQAITGGIAWATADKDPFPTTEDTNMRTALVAGGATAAVLVLIVGVAVRVYVQRRRHLARQRVLAPNEVRVELLEMEKEHGLYSRGNFKA